MAIEVCCQFLSHIFIKGLKYIQEFMILLSKIYHHQNTRKKEQLSCYLDLVVYDDSISLTIEDECGTHTFLINNFTNYIIIFNDINSSQ